MKIKLFGNLFQNNKKRLKIVRKIFRFLEMLKYMVYI